MNKVKLTLSQEIRNSEVITGPAKKRKEKRNKLTRACRNSSRRAGSTFPFFPFFIGPGFRLILRFKFIVVVVS